MHSYGNVTDHGLNDLKSLALWGGRSFSLCVPIIKEGFCNSPVLWCVGAGTLFAQGTPSISRVGDI